VAPIDLQGIEAGIRITCVLSYQPTPFNTRRVGKNGPRILAHSLVLFFFSPPPPGPMSLSFLQALVIHLLLYLTELCSTRRAPFLFLCGIFAVRLPGMPSVVSVHYLCFDMVSCTWVPAMSVLQHLSSLFNRIAIPLLDESPVTYFSSLLHYISPSCGLRRLICSCIEFSWSLLLVSRSRSLTFESSRPLDSVS
jgi:hypothetical protein